MPRGGIKTGRLKPCRNCGKDFYCQPSVDAGGSLAERLYCSFACGVAGRFSDPDKYLWEHIDKKHPSGCWVYSGAVDQHGYGRPAKIFPDRVKRRYYAHRRVYEIECGPIPEGMHVLHKCDNPPCCNPKHLFLGTHMDNMKDKRAKGREARHDKNGRWIPNGQH